MAYEHEVEEQRVREVLMQLISTLRDKTPNFQQLPILFNDAWTAYQNISGVLKDESKTTAEVKFFMRVFADVTKDLSDLIPDEPAV